MTGFLGRTLVIAVILGWTFLPPAEGLGPQVWVRDGKLVMR